MAFNASTYDNFVSERSSAQSGLFAQYSGGGNDFDAIIIGSGIGGGILADDLAERLGNRKRILVLEAGSYLYPTHVYNVCRFDNASVAGKFGCTTFRQTGNETTIDYIHEKPQLNFGGRSIFWSGLIPSIQPWELIFFPPGVRNDLSPGFLTEAGEKMNESVSMGSTARAIVGQLQQSTLAEDFDIQETPRALHQPYLTPRGELRDQLFVEPTGVFNTAELLTNQLGSNSSLHLLLNHFVENVERQENMDRYQVITRNTLNSQQRTFVARSVVLCGGSIESPKLLRRSTLYNRLAPEVQNMVGIGLTDHPTTDKLEASVTNIRDVQIPRNSHAKIIFYSRGRRDESNGQILYPFNVEMNVNDDYWHFRRSDPDDQPISTSGDSEVTIRFSFGNCVYGGNEIVGNEYVPELRFRNLNWTNHLSERFAALAGWRKNGGQIFAVLEDVSRRIFSQFQYNGSEARPTKDGHRIWLGQRRTGFGRGTVHHAACSLRMPFRWTYDYDFEQHSVVDENLQVNGAPNMYVCDMSVMPFSSAANPVRTLAALALRLSRRLSTRI